MRRCLADILLTVFLVFAPLFQFGNPALAARTSVDLNQNPAQNEQGPTQGRSSGEACAGCKAPRLPPLDHQAKLGPPLSLSSDPCGQANSLIAALPASGGVVDLSGIVGNQTCSVTLNIPVPATIRFGYATWIFGGFPGIHITSYGAVSLQGMPYQYAYSPATPTGTVFVSGSQAPLIADDGSVGSKIENIELSGNNQQGTFGFLGSIAGGMRWQSVHVHHFRYAGIIALGGLNTFHDLLCNSNGGTGVMFANDAVMDGNSQIALNGGVGVHAILGGDRLTDVDSDHNGLHGIYLDGRQPGDWTPNQQYIPPTLIKPVNGNPGGYYFLSVNVGGTSASLPPTWPQGTNAVVTDGSVQWVNVSALQYLPPGDMIVSKISGGTVDDNGINEPAGFVSDNIRIEGASLSNYSAAWNEIDSTVVQQAQVTQYAVTGIHTLNSRETVITGAHWLGGAWGDANAGDAGGYVIENSFNLLLSSSTSDYSTHNAVKVINSTYSTIQGFTATDTGISTESLSDTYCIWIDGNSNHIQLSDIQCQSGNGYGRGIGNNGQNTTVNGYTNSTPANSPDYLGSIPYYISDSGNATFASLSTSQTASVTTTVASISPGDCQEYNLNIQGTTTASTATLGIVGDMTPAWQGLTLQAHVSSNAVKLYVCNPTGAALTPESRTINVAILNH